MKVYRLILLAGVIAACTACSSLDSHKADRTTPEIVTDRQILVMLKEFPARHYLPGYFLRQSYATDASEAQLQTARQIANEYGFRLLSDWVMPSIGVRCFLGEVFPGEAPGDVALRLTVDPRVESAQPVQVFHALRHTDTYYELQTNAKMLRLDEVHRIATGKQVRVAQIDTGVELTHPDLDGQFSDARNFVDGTGYVAESHGTAVAGIIAAKADNGIGIVGVAPNATLMPLRACWENGDRPDGAVCSSFTLAKAIQYVLSHRARVLNLSLAGPRDRLLERLIDKAIDQGITVVGAVDVARPEDSFPATHPGVIAVGTAGTAIVVSGEVLAPGERVLTTTLNGSWGFLSGSSFAAAQVSGVVALLLESSPPLRPGDISRILREHVQHTGPESSVVDACAALVSVSASLDCHCCDVINSPARRQARVQAY
jgi:subtilisin family serine protease